jgi:sec-independent protein translocase protein TatA
MYLAFLNLGPTEVIVILVVAVLVFGGRMPEVARNLGRWFYDIKGGMAKLNRDIYAPPPPKPPEITEKPADHIEPYISDEAVLDRSPYALDSFEEGGKEESEGDKENGGGGEEEDSVEEAGGGEAAGEEDKPKDPS